MKSPKATEPTTQKNVDETKKHETAKTPASSLKKEIGGRGGPEPTRYGDWEKDGKCVDF